MSENYCCMIFSLYSRALSSLSLSTVLHSCECFRSQPDHLSCLNLIPSHLLQDNNRAIRLKIQHVKKKDIGEDSPVRSRWSEAAIENPVGRSRGAGVPPCRCTGKFQTLSDWHTSVNSHESRDRVNLIIGTRSSATNVHWIFWNWNNTTARRTRCSNAKLSWQRVLRYCVTVCQGSLCARLSARWLVEGMMEDRWLLRRLPANIEQHRVWFVVAS